MKAYYKSNSAKILKPFKTFTFLIYVFKQKYLPHEKCTPIIKQFIFHKSRLPFCYKHHCCGVISHVSSTQ